LSELKLIKEINLNSFEYGVYAFSFEISDNYPYEIIKISNAIMMGTDAVKDIYNENTIKEAIKELGNDKSYYTIPIKEFLH
jgi:hypothetical protein